MSGLGFNLPATELSIIWRYVDGVSQALATRFEHGSSPGEENLTFLLCELLDDGTTARHMLKYPLRRAKEDLAQADGGITLDVSFQTHEHTKHVEHNFSGADLGLIFVIDHPFFGRSERAVLLQAKRLFPNSAGYSLTSSFTSFHNEQRDLLKEIERRFAISHSIFYLWYMPSSTAFPSEEAQQLRSLEAMTAWDWRNLRGLHPLINQMMEFGWSWSQRCGAAFFADPQGEKRQRAWRLTQPATRVSELSVVADVTSDGRAPRLISLYNARNADHRPQQRWSWLAFEPLAELILSGMLYESIGDSSKDWIRLARGEKVPMPGYKARKDQSEIHLPELIPAPKHTLTFTLRSSLKWPQDLPRPHSR